ncbi:MAG: T9SS type A sorting domain-containing protein [Bacteroidia bacterium]
MRKFLLLLFVCCTGLLSAQTPTITWEKSIGGTTDDYGYFVNSTADGGFITLGSTTSADGDMSANFGGYDVLLSKLDGGGNLQWVKNLGGSLLEEGYSVYQTPEGGYLITGDTRSSDIQVSSNYGMRDVWVVKTNAVGTIQWENTYGGTGDDRAYYSTPTSDGGYIMAGYTESSDNDVSSNHGFSDVWVVKIDSAGAIQWENTYGGSNYDYGYFIAPTADGGYIVTAYSYSNDADVSGNHGGADIWLFKINSTGVLQWQKSYGGTNEEYCTATYPTADGGYISLNYTYSNDGDITSTHGDLETWLMKLSGTGAIQWQKCYGGSFADANYALKKTIDNKYVIAGYAYSGDGDIVGQHPGGEADYWIMQTDTSGTIEWSQCYGGTGDDEAFSIIQLADSSFVVTGLAASTDGDVTANRGAYDAWTIRLKQPGIVTGIADAAAPAVSRKGELAVYPNPSDGRFTVSSAAESTLYIFDVYGNLIKTAVLSNTRTMIDLSENAKGMYFARIVSADGTEQNGKLILR